MPPPNPPLPPPRVPDPPRPRPPPRCHWLDIFDALCMKRFSFNELTKNSPQRRTRSRREECPPFTASLTSENDRTDVVIKSFDVFHDRVDRAFHSMNPSDVSSSKSKAFWRTSAVLAIRLPGETQRGRRERRKKKNKKIQTKREKRRRLLIRHEERNAEIDREMRSTRSRERVRRRRYDGSWSDGRRLYGGEEKA